MSNRRLAEIQEMFDQIGLGSPEERKRLTTLGGAERDETSTVHGAEEQIFIRLESNTAEPGETLNG